MAHAANISNLTEGLISALTAWTPEEDGRRLRHAKDTATRAFRSQLHPRVNQYDIQVRLEGLEEKFIVVNREPLADALRCRLDELATQSSKWTPEILALLLNLSDRPADKTRLSALDKNDDPSDPVPQLTWADIIADDPLTEEGIWDDVVIDSDYSEDDLGSISDESTAHPALSPPTSPLDEENVAAFARPFLDAGDETSLHGVEATQGRLWPRNGGRHAASLIEITEYQAIRESLSMLKGLPTNLYETTSNSDVQPRPYFRTSSCDASTFRHVMHNFSNIGTQVNSLRALATSRSQVELLQRLRVAIHARLAAFDRGVSQIEQRFLALHSDVVVSFQSVCSEVQGLSSPLVHLFTATCRTDSRTETWSILDSLFDACCDLQLCGTTEDFLSVAGVFFDCLEVYLRPVHVWMVQGKLQDHTGSFFVRSSNSATDLGHVWRSGFALAYQPDGAIDAPRFMQSAANKIFIAGKNVMLLEILRHDTTTKAIDRIHFEGFNATTILESLEDSLLPLTGVFDTELQRWIGELQSHSMRSLREVLITQCGMGEIVNLVGHLFLAKDGARFQRFADEIFARIDRSRSWTDRFVLTDLAQSTLGLLPSIDTQRLSVRMLQRQSSPEPGALPSEDLDRIHIDYTVSWPIRNVIGDFAVCQRAFTVLLRVYRAEYLLTKQQWAVQAARVPNGTQNGPALVLRQRLIWFTSMFRGYASGITETTLQELRSGLDKAADLDGMALAYTRFQEKLEANLLLRKNLQPLFQAVLSLLDTCEGFALLWTQRVEVEYLASAASFTISTHRMGPLADSSDTDGSDGENEPRQETRPRSAASLTTLSRTYERQLHFLIAGLRGVSRIGGEPAWISLAERLQMGIDYATYR